MKMKDTLQIGRTKFPMRANLPEKEPERRENWFENEVYEQRLAKNEGKESFVLHDGPPFANGNIHIGHALNKISKDIIVRSKAMAGYYAPYVPGWDTHGLPVEQALANQGVDRKSMSTAEYRDLCRDYVFEQINKQRTDFKSLGVAGDWEDPYITLTKEYEADEIRVFGKMAEKGYIYRGQKPVYWSPSSESALAEAEIDYKDVRGPSIYVGFEVKDGKGIVEEGTEFVIWTTTPWTIPANEAIAVNPNYDYSVVNTGEKKYIVASALVDKLVEILDWDSAKVEKEIPGTDFEYMTAVHPLSNDRESLLVLGDHVTLDEGTGLVHTAPGHGDDDYQIGVKYGLDIYAPVDNQGIFTEEEPDFAGVFYDDTNAMITDKLKEDGKLLKLEFITHSYPHDWRTKKTIIFRATPQWFASIDDFRSDILDSIQDVDWILPWGQKRISDMVENRGDWVISRQRAWGVPLPIFYAENGEPIITPETTEHVAKLFEEHGSNVWFEREAKELLPEGFTHPSSPNNEFTKETDIMDVWFDSGSSHEAVLRQREELTFPADMYLEGSDQYRGWFNSSITTSVAINGVAPYKSVLSQGFVLDGNGRKMSKSLGNVIAPNEVTNEMGADILRLWVSSVDYSQDVRVSMDILKQTSESYRKIRNTMRFMIANTEDFDPKMDRVAYDDLLGTDKYIYNRLQEIIKEVREAYETYNFQKVYRTINLFVVTDMSNFFLDLAKDVVYIEAEDSLERRSMQTVMYDALVALASLLTPIIPHTTEEIWSYLNEEEEYVQLTDFPEPDFHEDSENILNDWKAFMNFRDDVLKSLEEKRNEKVIGKSFEAHIDVYADSELKDLFDRLDANVRQALIVSGMDVYDRAGAPEEADNYKDFDLVVTAQSGNVCERCWITSEEVGTIDEAPHLCERCYSIVKENFPEALVEEEA